MSNEFEYLKQGAVLEAGCGRRWPFDRSDMDVYLVGIDLDDDALAMRTDLDRKLHGDIRTASFPEDSFDAIYSSFVLEHVQGAEKALDNFARWVKPGGHIVIVVPDRDSVYGFLTRTTPLWVHTLTKRWVFGNKNAGKPGYGPYPTYHEHVIGQAGMRQFVDTHDLELVETKTSGRMRGWIQLVCRMVSYLSFGRLAHGHINLTYVLRRHD
ncbi:MAG: class I SAM-dependent methyltransferase [Pseudomonadales bacterium]